MSGSEEKAMLLHDYDLSGWKTRVIWRILEKIVDPEGI
jgi:hypothetical protein